MRGLAYELPLVTLERRHHRHVIRKSPRQGLFSLIRVRPSAQWSAWTASPSSPTGRTPRRRSRSPPPIRRRARHRSAPAEHRTGQAAAGGRVLSSSGCRPWREPGLAPKFVHRGSILLTSPLRP